MRRQANTYDWQQALTSSSAVVGLGHKKGAMYWRGTNMAFQMDIVEHKTTTFAECQGLHAVEHDDAIAKAVGAVGVANIHATPYQSFTL
jgi:hypothetical protein